MDLTAYMRLDDEHRQHVLDQAEQAHHAAGHDIATMLLADAAIAARIVFAGAATVWLDLAADADATVLRVSDPADTPPWTADRAGDYAERHNAAIRSIAAYCADAPTFNPNAATELDHPEPALDRRRHRITLPTPEPRTIPLHPHPTSSRPDDWQTPAILRVHCRYTNRTERLGLGYIGTAGTYRTTLDATTRHGPHAFTFALATVIDNHGGTAALSAQLEAEGHEHHARPGDRFLFNGNLFELRDDQPHPDRYPTLHPVVRPNAAREPPHRSPRGARAGRRSNPSRDAQAKPKAVLVPMPVVVTTAAPAGTGRTGRLAWRLATHGRHSLPAPLVARLSKNPGPSPPGPSARRRRLRGDPFQQSPPASHPATSASRARKRSRPERTPGRDLLLFGP